MTYELMKMVFGNTKEPQLQLLVFIQIVSTNCWAYKNEIASTLLQVIKDVLHPFCSPDFHRIITTVYGKLNSSTYMYIQCIYMYVENI